MKAPDGLTRAWWQLIGFTAGSAAVWSVFALMTVRYPDNPPWWAIGLALVCFVAGLAGLGCMCGYGFVEIPRERRSRRRRVQR